jgi:hypothetical protein
MPRCLRRAGEFATGRMDTVPSAGRIWRTRGTCESLSVDELRSVIVNGSPSSGMPAFRLAPADLEKVTSLLRSLSASASEANARGDRGRREPLLRQRRVRSVPHGVRPGQGGGPGSVLCRAARSTAYCSTARILRKTSHRFCRRILSRRRTTCGVVGRPGFYAPMRPARTQ